MTVNSVIAGGGVIYFTNQTEGVHVILGNSLVAYVTTRGKALENGV